MKYCRINLSKTNYQVIDNYHYINTFTELPEIYKKYCEYKQFESVIPLFDSYLHDPNCETIGYYDNSKLVAFSIIKKHDSENVEAVQFAWDYTNPRLRLGIKSLENECAVYKARGFKYLYLGITDKYKEQFDGYEVLGPI